MKNCLLLSIFLSLTACVVQAPGMSARKSASTLSGVDNSPSKAGASSSYVLQDNPIVVSGNSAIDAGSLNLALYLDPVAIFITDNPYLIKSCLSIGSCIEAKKDALSDPLTKNQGTWAYSANSSEFLQVNTYYHVGKVGDLFLTSLQNYHGNFFSPKAFPTTWASTPRSYWLNDGTASVPLQVFSEGNSDSNAYFEPAQNALSFGVVADIPGFKFAQDPDVIHHESGHVISQVMLNMRKPASTQSVQLYATTYDEMGMISEGFSDFMSYLISNRSLMGAWGVGRYFNQARPVSEDDPLHLDGISTDEDSRLSYPRFLNYDPNNPASPMEDIHYAGQIYSHMLVAFSKAIGSACGYSWDKDIENNTLAHYMLGVLADTFAELGDQTCVGRNTKSPGYSCYYDVALSPTDRYALATDWIQKINPINIRRFSQVFAKNLWATVGEGGSQPCFLKNDIESLLDQYGLLLFESYNDDGGSGQVAASNKKVTPANRKRSILINKSYIDTDVRTNTYSAYIFDKRADISAAFESLVASGQLATGDISSVFTGDDKFPYNNSNGKISPGEFVGLALNLYNNSNYDMGGVQVLANDWDHVTGTYPNIKACNNFADAWPTTDEGGTSTDDCATARDPTRIAPVCLVQHLGTNSTTWVSQEVLQKEMELPASKCLGGSGSTSDCFVKFPKGVDQSWYSRIGAKSTWSETLKINGTAPSFDIGNLLFMEVSPEVPPGTTFNCRMRVRFSNCKDCFYESSIGDDYLEEEYAGAKPFKIINFKFTVTD